MAEVGKFICFTISDTGLGINLPNSEFFRIFGLYKRMHSHTEGKGLGLYMVKTQLDVLEGKIEVESEPNKGSLFRVYFPKN